MHSRLAPESSTNLDIYAHRGSTILAPENTAPAFDMALSHAADVLEIDVRISRDRQVVVIHDARVDRTCNGMGSVAGMTFSELKKLDAAHHFQDPDGCSYRGRGTTLMSLDEMFQRYPDVRINIDIKDDSKIAARSVARSIEQASAQSRVNVGSFHAAALQHFRQQAPEVSTAASRREVAQLYFLGASGKASPAYRYLQIPVSFMGLPLTGSRFMQRAQANGIQLVYWTINEPEAMQHLISRGAQGIVTDRPDLAQAIRQARMDSVRDPVPDPDPDPD